MELRTNFHFNKESKCCDTSTTRLGGNTGNLSVKPFQKTNLVDMCKRPLELRVKHMFLTGEQAESHGPSEGGNAARARVLSLRFPLRLLARGHQAFGISCFFLPCVCVNNNTDTYLYVTVLQLHYCAFVV